MYNWLFKINSKCNLLCLGALKDVRPHGWCLTPQYLDFLAIEVTDNQVVLPQWTPGNFHAMLGSETWNGIEH